MYIEDDPIQASVIAIQCERLGVELHYLRYVDDLHDYPQELLQKFDFIVADYKGTQRGADHDAVLPKHYNFTRCKMYITSFQMEVEMKYLEFISKMVLIKLIKGFYSND